MHVDTIIFVCLSIYFLIKSTVYFIKISFVLCERLIHLFEDLFGEKPNRFFDNEISFLKLLNFVVLQSSNSIGFRFVPVSYSQTVVGCPS